MCACLLSGLCFLSYVTDLCGKKVGFLVDGAEQEAALGGIGVIMARSVVSAWERVSLCWHSAPSASHPKQG